ncbi:hypothetical protein [Salinarimonas soli]|uniref:Uncharacterized protein n=1 Tax=Salinarimonas soli TaxID=1638099 RepID=A0A5B2VFQ4_9HYPH|nr:hypothetical protein [Salinarimonas soli]KAA2237695.1 hypothetical protein F0L46_08425 [Salinarimonas soli]
MSNIIALNTALTKQPAIQVTNDLIQSVERISDAARRMGGLDMEAEVRAQALLDLFEAARLIQQAAAAVEAAVLARAAV